jgi:hypothetical protein
MLNPNDAADMHVAGVIVLNSERSRCPAAYGSLLVTPTGDYYWCL